MIKITMKIVNLLLIMALVMATGGCDETLDQPTNLDASGLDPASRPPVREGVLGPLPVIDVKIGGEIFTLEIADEEPERQQGLMFRKSMPARHGMIFVWPDPRPRGFWMKDTEVPLDLVFLDASGKVVAILAGRPFDRSRIFSETPCKSVIELNQGTARQLGLKLGDVIELPDSIR